LSTAAPNIALAAVEKRIIFKSLIVDPKQDYISVNIIQSVLLSTQTALLSFSISSVLQTDSSCQGASYLSLA